MVRAWLPIPHSARALRVPIFCLGYSSDPIKRSLKNARAQRFLFTRLFDGIVVSCGAEKFQEKISKIAFFS
jgi:hypothetical protein